jgi:hypothetical protein
LGSAGSDSLASVYKVHVRVWDARFYLGVIYMMKALRGMLILLGSAAILTVSAATAFAGDGYASGGVAGESTGGGTGGGGTLPFTGTELAAYLVIGLLIVGCGLALRAYSARRVS